MVMKEGQNGGLHSTGQAPGWCDAAQYAGTCRRYNKSFICPDLPLQRRQETSMKTIAIVMLAIAASGCSAFRNKPYQASDTTASATQMQAPGPTQRSTQRMFNPDGSLGTYFGT
jgi:hypothetical protein